MPDFPARRIDDREHWPELTLSAQVVGDAPGVLARRFQRLDKASHAFQSSECE
jgi:hypothetical protein